MNRTKLGSRSSFHFERETRGRTKHVHLLTTILVLLALGCASVGGGRAEVVKAEDVLVNSQNTWNAFMSWHKSNSTRESVEVYKVMETARVEYPKARQVLRSAIRAYKRTGVDATDMQKAVAVVEALIDSLKKTGVL